MRKICGVGVNDVSYAVHRKTKGVIVWVCPYYKVWKKMIERCYSVNFLNNNPSYAGCTVETEWLYLSNFIKWVDSQPNIDWQTCELDKDLLFQNNKHYGKHTCAFVSKITNNFLVGCMRKSKYLMGVSWKKSNRKFQATCNNPFTKHKEFLGYYTNEVEAHLAWKVKKHEIACVLAQYEKDERVSKVLLHIYSPLN